MKHNRAVLQVAFGLPVTLILFLLALTEAGRNGNSGIIPAIIIIIMVIVETITLDGWQILKDEDNDHGNH